ncbi:DUF6069 family protein [Embleya hyalina]|uniref:Uncharacterized protein n=1 Tax=Embleya hyalina TaxID=516124 RepID=A0A401YIV3_9ACTN|nr:DUF6069 family protein [Embleya hyalina]GCD94533.1 hypothetical protein EHYA_02202 [Embleya hyalina]
MAQTVTRRAAHDRSIRTLVSTRPVWLVSVAAGAVAAVATEAYGLIARGLGTPMRAGNIGAATAEPITVGMFAMGVAVAMTLGTLSAVLIARRAARPARTYLRTTVALTALSMISPILAGDTAISTRLMLCGAHLVAAAVVVPTVTRRLADADRTPRA